MKKVTKNINSLRANNNFQVIDNKSLASLKGGRGAGDPPPFEIDRGLGLGDPPPFEID